MATSFGYEMRKHFPFEDGYTNMNHGSFGSVPNSVLQAQQSFTDRSERRPDAFLRHESITLLNESRATLAKALSAPVSSIVMVLNATTGVNTVLRNLKYAAGDVLVYFSTSYGACQNIVHATCEFAECQSHCIDLVYPLSDDEVVRLFVDALVGLKNKGLNAKAALIDTIVSLPAVRMPFERLVNACKDNNVLSVLDAAHGYGHLPLDLTTLDPDFMVSNCHKWGFTPRPSAVFYVPQRNQHLIRTTFPTSHYFTPLTTDSLRSRINPLPAPTGADTPFTKQFEFIGTPGNAPYYCVQAALAFRQQVCGGEEAIQTYCADLALNGGEKVAEMLGTEILDHESGCLTRGCAMVNVRLPVSFDGSSRVVLGAGGVTSVVQWLQRESMGYETFLPFFVHGEALWTRLSAQVYLELSDFVRAGEVVRALCGRLVEGEHLNDDQAKEELVVR